MADLAVRLARKADLPAVLALYAQPDFNDGRVVSLEEAEAILARFAAYPDYGLYVAEAEGTVVGTFCLLVLDNIAHWGTPAGLVESVVVSTAHQGRGVGRAMMRAAFRIAEQKGCYKVALSSGLRATRAHGFYEGLGFERYGYSFRLDPPFDKEVAA
ncbi:GNAT family N-acetyltransferase [Prosthecomicrobium pneumaticum]|uniref:GNAT superfamily N-acetyltransferase n=1 Tax=Prosthecomicrobium pneumaticum TaxID=81895 RepID=A0A7W9FLM1_9HYPH|nr:GNAT family N-acetyltransferase [Prosthecomicrobium pneumaticum]MBB5752942.1 GNAT superfamily N-acetyltransferase [Prosthecomicrobium pneumaticum]